MSNPTKPLRLEYVKAGSLADNPKNWRLHPDGQKAALASLLANPEVGWAGALLFNERTGRLIDGHARKAISDPEQLVPVLIGSWSEEAEATILATLDPLAAMAEADGGQLKRLLDEAQISGEKLAELRKGLERQIKAATPKNLSGDSQLAGYTFKVIVDCRDEAHQREMLARFDAEGFKVTPLIV